MNEEDELAAGCVRKAALTERGVAEQNRYLLRRYSEFRRAADAVAAAWRRQTEVRAIALIGSLAKAPFKEIPRFSEYRRAGVALWHECKDVDLAVWLDRLEGLAAMRAAKGKALRKLYKQVGFSVADHQVDAFLLEPGSDRYLGRLCGYNLCPKGKADCGAPGCGATQFLKQHEGFLWRPDSLTGAVILFDRATNCSARAADLTLPLE